MAKLREMVLKKNPLNSTYDKDASQLNSTYTKPADSSQLNSTYTKAADQSQTYQSYDITPARHELPPEPLKEESNYNIEDLKSDDDTDDDENPRKVIPKWASGNILLNYAKIGSNLGHFRDRFPHCADASSLQPTGR